MPLSLFLLSTCIVKLCFPRLPNQTYRLCQPLLSSALIYQRSVSQRAILVVDAPANLYHRRIDANCFGLTVFICLQRSSRYPARKFGLHHGILSRRRTLEPSNTSTIDTKRFEQLENTCATKKRKKKTKNKKQKQKAFQRPFKDTLKDF